MTRLVLAALLLAAVAPAHAMNQVPGRLLIKGKATPVFTLGVPGDQRTETKLQGTIVSAEGDFGFMTFTVGAPWSMMGMVVQDGFQGCQDGEYEVVYPAGTLCSTEEACPARAIIPRVTLLRCDNEAGGGSN